MTLLDRVLDVLRYRVLHLPRPWWRNLGDLGAAMAEGIEASRRDERARAAAAQLVRNAQAAEHEDEHEDGLDADEATLERMAIDAWSHTLPAGDEVAARQLWARLPAVEQRTWRRCAWSMARHLDRRAPFPP